MQIRCMPTKLTMPSLMQRNLLFTAWICGLLALLPACSASVPEVGPPQVAKVVLQPIYPPKASPDVVELCAIADYPERPITEISPVSTRAWSLEDGIRTLKEKAALLGADAIVNLRHKARFNVEHSQNMYYVYADAILWKHGRNSEYVVSDGPPNILPVD